MKDNFSCNHNSSHISYNVENANNSQFQYGTYNSTQTMQNQNLANEEVQLLLKDIKESLNECGLSNEDSNRINFQIKAIENEVQASNPIKEIISSGLSTIMSVLKGAAKNIIVAGLIDKINEFL